jgi:nitroreductase
LDVSDAIKSRRAFRSLEKVEITRELVEDLAMHAGLSPSCFNNQPWRYVFVYDSLMLEKIYDSLSRGNKWAELASLIVAVFSREEDDCKVRGRVYNLFDVGMATAFMILRATELGLVAHPIAGFDEFKVKKILGIPEEFQAITLVNIGRHSEKIHPYLSEKQRENEVNRPRRKSFDEFCFINNYK